MMKLEVDKEYWIKGRITQVDEGDLQPYKVVFGDEHFSDYVWIPEGVEVVKAIPEREKVVIPRFVADWIEACKRDGDALAFVLEGDHDIAEWLETEGNEELLARAYLDGYEVEKEPLYTVEIPDPYGEFHHVVLYRNNNGNVAIDRLNFDDWKIRDKYKLTEEEIKQNHEWAWQWAKPVEE